MNGQNVNSSGSKLALTEAADFETACPVEGFSAALVIGNAYYQEHDALPGVVRDALPGVVRDAQGMASTLEGRGYAVDHRRDLTADEPGHGDACALHGVDAAERTTAGRVPTSELLSAASRLKSAGVKTEVVIDACEAGGAVDEALEAER